MPLLQADSVALPSDNYWTTDHRMKAAKNPASWLDWQVAGKIRPLPARNFVVRVLGLVERLMAEVAVHSWHQMDLASLNHQSATLSASSSFKEDYFLTNSSCQHTLHQQQ